MDTRSMYRRLAQASLGATAAFGAVVASTYHAQYRWFPDGCVIGSPRPWLSGVGSSLEMHAALGPLFGNAFEAGWWLLVLFAFVAALIPPRVSLRGQLVGAGLVFAATVASMDVVLNHWAWSPQAEVETCATPSVTAAGL